MIFNIFGLNLKKSTCYIILATLAWAIYWGMTEYNFQLKETVDSVNYLNKDCQQTLAQCNQIKSDEVASRITTSLYVIFSQLAFFITLIGSFWFSFKYIFRFIKLGFANEVKWSVATKPKKAFVIYLIAFNFIVLLLIYAFLDEGQKLSSIAVTPNASSVVATHPKNNPTFVTAQGSWKSKDNYGFNDNVMQTSNIRCYKAEGVCYEASAVAGGRYMYSDLTAFQIQDWTSNSVSYGEDGDCRKDIYVINYETETISHSRTYKKLPNCSSSLRDENEYMVDGFDLHRDEYEKLDSLISRFIMFVFNDKPVRN